MKKELAVAVVALCVLAIVVGCMTQKEKEDWARAEPKLNDWLPGETIVVVEGTKKVDGLDMGRVIVRRAGDPTLFPLWVIPMREIAVGSEVRAYNIEYVSATSGIMYLHIVK